MVKVYDSHLINEKTELQKGYSSQPGLLEAVSGVRWAAEGST